ncbi:MAG TPA: maltose alpha-D-glucosyltransferase [Vicinamibacteria bacterium]|nr:maltose alpha-D-glucosyltransferase [Vicinamibacteria bacterium]
MTRRRHHPGLSADPLWYKDAIIYEVHVRAFRDSNADGIGDFNGLIRQLDYLEELGVTAIWLLPFYPSPLKDDGYDIADYTDVNPSYGTLADFRRFLREAHRRGLRVITELVINHTSSEHPWFQRAREAPPGSRYRDFYVWSDTPERYPEARIIFKDFETSNWTWDSVAKAYYWHRFYSHQPDLNFDNPEVQEEVFKVLDFWMSMGVDGMRLDAVPYLFEREGTNCENLPQTHAFLKKLRSYIDSRHRGRMLLAEANQWPEDAASYFGDGDECHMNFHFPLMPRMFMALHLEDRFPIIDILEQTPEVHSTCQWATFLRNHDELTLEMVTDEDRDYMWRVYAEDTQARINLGIRRRLAPLLGTRRKIELLNALLFSLPGTPVLYYGDEIGMGDNIYVGDRDGVRTPMQWSPDRNAGFSRANPQKLFLPIIVDPEYHYEARNVETQHANPSSFLWWMRRLIAQRTRHKAFGRGELRILHPENKKVLAFVRSFEEERILVVANLSRYSQHVELALQDYAGLVPEELFGRVAFPPIREQPYFLSLSPHTFFWFELTAPSADAGGAIEIPELGKVDQAGQLLTASLRERIEEVLPLYLRRQRWFRSKTRRIQMARIVEEMNGSSNWVALLVMVHFYEGQDELYFIPLAWSEGDAAQEILTNNARSAVAVATLSSGNDDEIVHIVLHDAALSERFSKELLHLLASKRVLRAKQGRFLAWARNLEDSDDDSPGPPRAQTGEQTNTSIVFGDRYILKLQRVVEAGVNCDPEIVRFLNERTAFKHVPELLATLDYQTAGREPASVAVLQRYVPNRGDAWQFTLETLDRYYEHVLAHPAHARPPSSSGPLLKQAAEEPSELLGEALGHYVPVVRLLGQRTAELHGALASERRHPAFAPEPFSELHQRSLYQAARPRLAEALDLLRRWLPRLPEAERARARTITERESLIYKRLRRITARKIEALRIRCHGDYHLGQILYTGRDFVIIDFEGEPARPISERRFKRCPLRDVAGMLRSFHYAATAALKRRKEPAGKIETLEPWARGWVHWVSAYYLRAYLESPAAEPFLPRSREDVEDLLQFYLLEKCFYELRYELNHRPEWVSIPLLGLADLLDEEEAAR